MILHQPVYFLSQAPALIVDGRLCRAPGGLQACQPLTLSGQLWLEVWPSLQVEGTFQGGRRLLAAAGIAQKPN